MKFYILTLDYWSPYNVQLLLRRGRNWSWYIMGSVICPEAWRFFAELPINSRSCQTSSIVLPFSNIMNFYFRYKLIVCISYFVELKQPWAVQKHPAGHSSSVCFHQILWRRWFMDFCCFSPPLLLNLFSYCCCLALLFLSVLADNTG